MVKVVFDTNVLFSALGWQGNPYHCVQAARQRRCLFITCEPILAELSEKLRSKRGFDESKTTETAAEIRAFSQIVTIKGTLKVVTADPDDDAVVECAVVGQAEFVVSGDHHLLDLGNHQGIQIVRAAEFLKQIERATEPHS